jgi:hypothetical protein
MAADRTDPDRLIHAGLLGLATTAVFGLVGKPLDGPLRAALLCFAAGIPLLAGCLVAAIGRGRHTPPLPPSATAAVVGLVAAALPVLGLAGFFLHFGREYLGTFAAVAALTVAAVRRL